MPEEITSQPSDRDRNTPQQPAAINPSPDAQAIFDARWQLFMNPFGESCEQQSVKTAIAIVVDPAIPQPLILVRGPSYDAAKVLAALLRQLQGKIFQEINP